MNMKERLELIESAKSKTAKLKLLSSFIREAKEERPVKKWCIEDFIEALMGQMLSVDVSTGENDAFTRYIGKVDGISNSDTSTGIMLLSWDGKYTTGYKDMSFVEAMRFLYLGKAVRPMGFTEWLIRRGNSFMWVDCLGYPAKLIPNILNISSEAKWERRDQPV